MIFQIYDSDSNGLLDTSEMDAIIEQMMHVARCQKWDTIELEQVWNILGSYEWSTF